MQPCFSTSLLKQLIPCFADTARVVRHLRSDLAPQYRGMTLTSQLANRWEETLLENAPYNVIDVVPWMHRGALDVIGSGKFFD